MFMTRVFAASSLALVGLTASLPVLAEPTADEGGGMTLSVPAPPAPLSRPARDSGPPLLFGSDIELGGYGGLDVMYTRMFGRDGVIVGAQGALLVNHRLALGIAGYGFSNPLSGPDDLDGDAQHFETGYGGFTLRYSLMSEELPVYFTVGGLVGGGAVHLTDGDDGNDDDFDGFRDGRESDTFAVFQPDVTLHANLTRWMRLGATGGYRFTSGVNRLGFEESDLNGVIVGGHVQFGRF
jgi:hypothetical protein